MFASERLAYFLQYRAVCLRPVAVVELDALMQHDADHINGFFSPCSDSLFHRSSNLHPTSAWRLSAARSRLGLMRHVRCMNSTARAHLHPLTWQRTSVLLDATRTPHQVFFVHARNVCIRHKDPSSPRRTGVNKLPAFVTVVFVPRHHGYFSTEPVLPLYVSSLALETPVKVLFELQSHCAAIASAMP